VVDVGVVVVGGAVGVVQRGEVGVGVAVGVHENARGTARTQLTSNQSSFFFPFLSGIAVLLQANYSPIADTGQALIQSRQRRHCVLRGFS
jgi:hypothetical protein